MGVFWGRVAILDIRQAAEEEEEAEAEQVSLLTSASVHWGNTSNLQLQH